MMLEQMPVEQVHLQPEDARALCGHSPLDTVRITIMF